MTIKQQIKKFFEANQNLKKTDSTLYHTYYKATDYKYDNSQNKHELIINSIFSNQRIYVMERIGDLHPDLLECLKKKEEIVFFWSHEQLGIYSKQFTFWSRISELEAYATYFSGNN